MSTPTSNDRAKACVEMYPSQSSNSSEGQDRSRNPTSGLRKSSIGGGIISNGGTNGRWWGVAWCKFGTKCRLSHNLRVPILHSSGLISPARGGESDRDFVHKLGIVLKELNESAIWLTFIQEGRYLMDSELGRIQEECTTMCRIIAASINTVRKRCENEMGRRLSKIENRKSRIGN